MKTLLAIASAGEGLTGLALLAYPPIVVKLLFGAEVVGIGVVMSRVAAIGLIALGLACWPDATVVRALRGMLTYSALAALYLLWLGTAGEWVGKLLWPAAAAHVILTALLARAWFGERKAAETKT